MSERAPYSRVYWSVRNDARLATIYCDDHHWAAWNRLLLAADMSWPAPADLPANVRKASLATLVEAGVIERLAGGLFVFHGLDAERGRRRVAASQGPKRDPDGTQEGPVSLPLAPSRAPASSRLGLSSLGSAPAREDDRPDVEAFLAVRYRVPTDAQRRFMDVYCHVFDATGPKRAARLIFANPDDPIGALKADLDAFRQERRAAAVAEEAPKVRPRRPPSAMTPLNVELSKLLAAEYAAQDAEMQDRLNGVKPEEPA